MLVFLLSAFFEYALASLSNKRWTAFVYSFQDAILEVWAKPQFTTSNSERVEKVRGRG